MRDDVLKSIYPWVVFAGSVLIVAVLYWAQVVLLPVALAGLLTFLITPVVTRLQRWLGRVPAVLTITMAAVALLGLVGWGLSWQVASVLDELPAYRENIRQRVRDIRGASRGGSVEKLQTTVDDIQQEINKDTPPPGTARAPVVVRPETAPGSWIRSTNTLFAHLARGGLIAVLVIFMLLERQDLRNRVMSVFGHGHLARTTRALDEAAERVSRYLLMQSLVNLSFGIGVGIGLFFIGVPYAMLWAVLASVVRFIPYVGPLIGALAPILVSLAVLDGWVRPALVVAVFVTLELFTSLGLETLLYTGATGVSKVGLLIAIAFWTWLWGPLGLVVATPLTVCLVVLGKHIPGLELISRLMSTAAVMTPDVAYYQRLLAGDQVEAADLIEEHVVKHSGDSVRRVDPARAHLRRARPRRGAPERGGGTRNRGRHQGVDRRRRDGTPNAAAGRCPFTGSAGDRARDGVGLARPYGCRSGRARDSRQAPRGDTLRPADRIRSRLVIGRCRDAWRRSVCRGMHCRPAAELHFKGALPREAPAGSGPRRKNCRGPLGTAIAGRRATRTDTGGRGGLREHHLGGDARTAPSAHNDALAGERARPEGTSGVSGLTIEKC